MIRQQQALLHTESVGLTFTGEVVAGGGGGG